MRRAGRDIIVIGASAGGLEALDRLVGQLPSDVPASLFVVQHMGAQGNGKALLHRLSKYASFQCGLAVDQETFKPGRLYIAPPDFHLLIKPRTMLVTKGARENRYRPAIDPMFRSAAVSHGPRVIGVILTGLLDDGAAGLRTIKECGGVAVVQDPEEAAYPDMPRAALSGVNVDHCVPVGRMGPLLDRLSRTRPGRKVSIPKAARIEAEIAERVLSDVEQVNGLGDQVPYNCPNCGGVLWVVEKDGTHRYRCHTGHSFTGPTLLTSQSERIEETLWVSLRMLEERKNLLNNMAQTAARPRRRDDYREQARENDVHIERIRAMLLSRETRLPSGQ